MSEDKKVWENYTQGVEPAQKRKRKLLANKAVPDKTAARKAAEKAPTQLAGLKLGNPLTGSVFLPLERKREKSLRQGDMEIEAKLDLHGLTQVEAFEALAAFMQRVTKAGKRHLLIITGKGRGGDGVLRRSLQSWLGQLPQASAVLALRAAAPKHGGEGAFYVVLRRGEKKERGE